MKTIQPVDVMEFHPKFGDLSVYLEQCYKTDKELATGHPICYKDIC